MFWECRLAYSEQPKVVAAAVVVVADAPVVLSRLLNLLESSRKGYHMDGPENRTEPQFIICVCHFSIINKEKIKIVTVESQTCCTDEIWSGKADEL